MGLTCCGPPSGSSGPLVLAQGCPLRLSARVVWIGWDLNLSHFCVRLDPAKFARLCALLRQALSSKRCSTHLLERITGKLLWFSSLFRTFRPSLAPLYADQHAFLPTMTALQPELWEPLRASLSNDLVLLKPIGLAAIPPGSLLLRVGQKSVSKLTDLPALPPDSRRLWLQSSSPNTGACVLSDASQEVLRLWLDLCESGTAIWSAWPSLTPALLLRRPVWAGLFGSLMTASCSSATPSAVKTCTGSSPGSRSPPLRSLSLHHGSSWLNVLWSSLWMPSWVQVICPSTASSNAIIPPPTPPVGRVFQWHRDYATYSVLFLFSCVPTGPPHIGLY